MLHPRSLCCLGIILFGLVMLSGCAHSLQQDKGAIIVASSESFSRFSGEFQNTDYFKRNKPVSVSVLPFKTVDRKTFSLRLDSEDPGQIVRRGMYNHIASLPFRDLELADTDQRLKNAGLTDLNAVDAMIASNPRKLRSILGVDSVVTGEITHFDRYFLGIYSQIAVGCEVKMWDLKRGRLLWRAKHVQRAHAGGVSTTPLGLVLASVASVMNLKSEEMLSQTDDLFREIVSTIDLPEATLAARTAAPRIDLFAVANANKPFTVGESVTFRLIGPSGGRAYVDLGDFQSGIDLAPVSAASKSAMAQKVLSVAAKAMAEAGEPFTPALRESTLAAFDARQVYEGHFQVAPGQQAYGVIARGYLVDENGMQAQALDTAHPVDIDAQPPAAVSAVTAESLDGRVAIAWAPVADADLAGYEIWTSGKAITGYGIADTSESPGVILSGQRNFTPFHIKVRARDRAGNVGAFSPVTGGVALPAAGLMALPRPGAVLSGTIDVPVLLTAEKSPYTIASSVTVTAGGDLNVGPGVELRFAPASRLIVDSGRIHLFGQQDRPIRMLPQQDGASPGAWSGLELRGASEAVLSYFHVDRARVGITVADCAPEFTRAVISNSAQVGIHLLSGARPAMTCSAVTGSSGQGGLVMEGTGLKPNFSQNAFTNNLPFQVQNFAPLQIDLGQNFWGAAGPTADAFLGEIAWKPVLSELPTNCGTFKLLK